MVSVIKIENLYKEYNLGTIGHGTLYRDIQSFVAKIRGREDPNSIIGFANKKKHGKILAINNVNLEVEEGEVLGIIGLNGAGKSTLLKLLSRVTSPTKGLIKIKGRVTSLLEVGTGFHPELTGRENIFLNGAINGMSDKDIKKNLDEIVDFSGVEKYLDTPIKRYSSGMIVRLGFAIAAHISPDILIVDEVLSVGDISFRKKAAEKMKNVSETQGSTVLFVSHNMDSIKSLCTKTILLSNGSLDSYGKTNDIINKYTSRLNEKVQSFEGERVWDQDNLPGNDNICLLAIRSKKSNNKVSSEFAVTEEVIIEIDFEIKKPDLQIAVSMEFIDIADNLIFCLQDDYIRGSWGGQDPKDTGIYKTTFKIPKNFLNQGIISLGLNIYLPPGPANTAAQIKERNFFWFNVLESDEISGSRGSYPYHMGITGEKGSPFLRPLIIGRTFKIK